VEQKIKILGWFDCPQGSTGFSQVSKNVLKHLYATGNYEIDVVGVNYDGSPYDIKKYPYKIYPAVMPLSSNERLRMDVYGYQRLALLAGSGNYDLIFIINDLFIIRAIYPQLLEIQKKLPKEKRFEIICYFPIDCVPKKEWVTDVVAKCNFPVVYTQYGKKEILKHDPSLTDLKVIYHGVEKSDFFPYPKEDAPKLKREMFGPDHCNKFVALSVARNQPRKDLHKLFASFKIFHDKYPNSFLFMLAQAQDVGGDLIEIAKGYGLTWDKEWACPQPGSYGSNQGYSIEIVNKIYNASDVVVSSSLGEGWNLCISEAMATMKPLIVPRNTSMIEIIGENEERGWHVKSGATLNDWICLGPGDNSNIRPTIDVYDMANKLEYIYTHPDEARAKVERAYSEVWTWDVIFNNWRPLFDKAWNKVQVMRTTYKDLGRNEPCPCNSGKKFKACCM